jgi:Protein of unknown function (DUF3485)
MSRLPIRSVALFSIVLAAGIGTALLSARATPPRPAPVPPSTPVPMHSYLIDVAGWYEITPNESAVASPLDLTIGGLKALPTQLGRWSGAPYDLGSAVGEWFENPDLALSNLYQDDRGHQAWFSVFGSRGRKSYFLFEHTPITSYPAAGWTLIENGVAPVTIGASRIFVQQATLSKDNERRIVFYWYLWSDFDRDPAQGVLTVRLHVPVVSTDQDAVDAGADFIRALYPQVIAWHRF